MFELAMYPGYTEDHMEGDVRISMLVQLRQWGCLQDLIHLMAAFMAMLAEVEAFIVPAGVSVSGSSTSWLPVLARHSRMDVGISRYPRTARGFPQGMCPVWT